MPRTTSSRTPRVQIPVGADYHGLSIDGEFVYAWPEGQDHPGDENLANYQYQGPHLPELANDAYWKHNGTDNLGRVYACNNCGYLTMSTKARLSSYKKHECPNCETGGGHTQTWHNVYPDPINEENYVDVLAVEADADVPNHPSHLSRIQNQFNNYVTQSGLIRITERAVADARDAGHIDY